MKDKEKKINLVTGGAGFIGSHLIEKLLEKGEFVFCQDNFLTGSLINIQKFRKLKNFRVINSSILNQIDFDVDYIWHLASPASTNFYYKNPIATAKIIVQGTLNILDFAKKKNAKLLYASTSEIYGNVRKFPIEENDYCILKSSCERNCYADSKKLAETLCRDYKRLFSLDIRIARIFNTYGPKMSINDGRVVNSFIYNAINNLPIVVNGDGMQTRSFCFIDDLTNGLILLMNSNFTEPLNLGYPEETRIIDLANIIKERTNSKSEIVLRKNVLNEPIRRLPCIEMAKKHLNWSPLVSLVEGIDSTVNFIKNKSDRYA